MANVQGEARLKRVESFFDGNDICLKCNLCCLNVHGLLVTPEELEAVPKMKPFVVGFDGTFNSVNMPSCPYTLPEGGCTTFHTRPFDCSLYPANMRGILRRVDLSGVEAVYEWGGSECPKRRLIMGRGMSVEQAERLRQWVATATHTVPEQVHLAEEWRFHVQQARASIWKAIRRTPLVRPFRRAVLRVKRAM